MKHDIQTSNMKRNKLTSNMKQLERNTNRDSSKFFTLLNRKNYLKSNPEVEE